MKELQFSININTNKEQVWNSLWNDKSFRIWANNIDEGTYLLGEMKEWGIVQFISSESGFGVNSWIEKLTEYEYVLFRHITDTKDNGKQVREDQWTWWTESYLLQENWGVTTLTIKSQIPDELSDIFNERIPKALESIKNLSENSNLT